MNIVKQTLFFVTLATGLVALSGCVDTAGTTVNTDHVGGEGFNFDLSQKRAQSVVDYLIEKGINPQRLVAKGYGETWPKKITRKIAKGHDFLKRNDELTEAFILKLTTEQQEIATAINRRTEFRVLSTDFIERFDAEPEK